MVGTVRVRRRTWKSRGRHLTTWMLDYTDHNGERQRRVVKHPDAPWSADDAAGIENGKVHALRQAHKVADSLRQALLHHNTVPMIGLTMTVAEMVDQHIERSERQGHKCRGMRRYLERLQRRRLELLPAYDCEEVRRMVAKTDELVAVLDDVNVDQAVRRLLD